MTKQFATSFFTTIMVVIPFLFFTAMLLALWGVGGKAIYSDLSSNQQIVESNVNETKNYMVSEAKSCGNPDSQIKEYEISTIEKDGKALDNQHSKRIDWRTVV